MPSFLEQTFCDAGKSGANTSEMTCWDLLSPECLRDSSAGQESEETAPVRSLKGECVLHAHPTPSQETLVSVPDADRAVWPPQSGLILSRHKEAGMRWSGEGSFMIPCSQAECLRSLQRRHGGQIKAAASKGISI